MGPARRRYGFDPDGYPMRDAWWPPDAPEAAVLQSLRRAAPAVLRLLLDGTGPRPDAVAPGGGWDAAGDAWLPHPLLDRAVRYAALLRRA